MAKAIVFRTRSNEKVYPCPFYPVGSIYISVNSTNPSTYFGGTWEQIKDRFLLACGNSYGNGSTGGNTTHTHSYSHTHSGSASHSHSLSDNGYAKFHHSGSYFWFREIQVSTAWTDTAKAGSISGSTVSTSNSWGTALGGTTDSASVSITTSSQSTSTTGSSSNLPPYLAVYVWKRVS